jgi:hypothetical protein
MNGKMLVTLLKQERERCGGVVITPASYLGGSGFKSLPENPLSWENIGAALHITPRSTSSKSLPINYSLSVLQFDSVQAGLLAASLNKP